MALATPSPRARIVRWLDRRRLGCRTERSERNLLRTGGFPSIAVQISPRRGDTLWLVKVHLLSCGAQGVFEIGLLRGSLGGQPFEISGRLTLQSSPVVQPTSHFHCLVHCLSDAFGLLGDSLGGQPLEISARLPPQGSRVVRPTSHFHCLVHCLSDAFGFARLY